MGPEQVDHQVTPCVSIKGARKTYGSTVALRNGELHLRPGEVHALLGENGAGKSTLVKALAGAITLDSGTFLVNGKPVDFENTAASRQAGIAVIFQEPSLFADLSITENIYLGNPICQRFGRLHHQAMAQEVGQILQRLGVPLKPSQKVQGLSIADQQIVEIAKALVQSAQVLVMDEPTAALSKPEVDQLFSIVRQLCREGVAVLFITHRLEEVFALTQQVTIMRDGSHVHSGPTQSLTTATILKHMVGRELDDYYPRAHGSLGPVALKVSHLSREGVFHDVHFEVRQGEIVALAGLVGAGRSEIVRAVFGIDPATEGEVHVHGQRITLGDPAIAMAAGLAMVPEDRRAQGLVMDASIERNATLTIIQRLTRFGFVPPHAERRWTELWGQRLLLKARNLALPVSTLSGGNQQKVVLSKWMATQPKVLLIDEPTRGIDVGAKAEVYRALTQQVEQGLAVVMVSSELPEILGMADRVLVIHEGRVSATLVRGQATEENIMSAALGQTQPFTTLAHPTPLTQGATA